MIAISNIGWFGSQTALCATSFCNIMSGYLHIDFPLWLSCIIWGSLMFITSVYGVKLIDFLNRVSVPALFIMLIWGVIAALMRGAAAAVTVYQPPMVLGWTYGITPGGRQASPLVQLPVVTIHDMEKTGKTPFSPASLVFCLPVLAHWSSVVS